VSTRDSRELFSKRLELWLKSIEPKTLNGLGSVFEEKSFALVILVLMAIPALPIPTGGVTHVFEIISALLALELIIGRKSIWLPERWTHKPLGANMEQKVIPKLTQLIRRLEKYTRPRSTWIFKLSAFTRLIGLGLLILIITAFFAPPFTGLDTLPSLGVVAVCLAIILEDALLLLAGIIIGSAGLVVVIGLGKLIVNLISGS
jgi:hypothetical protein